MINSYSDIKDDIEHLYNNKSANDFISICSSALGGKRGLDKTQLIRAMASGSMDQIHNVLEPVVRALLISNQQAAEEQEDAYNIIPLGGSEYRLIKIEDKDKYGRGANDYIIDIVNNTCTCPEFVNRLRDISLPCKHQYMVNVPVASTIDKKSLKKGSSIIFNREEVEQLLKVADSLDRKGYFRMADIVERLMSEVTTD